MAFAILVYWRFKDDILLILRRKDRLRHFMICARARTAGVYRLEVERASRQWVDMLALLLEVRGGRIVAYPRPRPVRVQLCSRSAHP